MKTKLFGAAAVLTAFASGAHAQSSVTLYGIVDAGFNITTNSGGARLINMSSGTIQGSRFGMKGVEDLGGGLSTFFVLENGYDLASGKLAQGGLEFGRAAYVGLQSVSYGSVTLGRQYDALVDRVGILEAADQWGGLIAAHPGDIDNFNDAYRPNNTIKYASPNFGGFTFGGTYSFGGIAGNLTGNQIWSLSTGYNNGPVALGIGYLNARTPSAVGGLFNSSGTPAAANAAVTSPVYSGFQSAKTYQVIGMAGTYTVGNATFGATYSNIRFMGLGASTTSAYVPGNSVSFNNGEVNFKYQFTPALMFGIAFDYTKGGSVTAANNKFSAQASYYQTSLALDYFLSKRTDVYFLSVYQTASGTDSTGAPAVAAINGLTPSTNSHQLTARIGIRHKF